MLKLSKPNISEDAIAAVADVLRSGQLVHGNESELFEQELSEYLGCNEVVLVSSGTAALHVALQALDIGVGDAVIIPDFTFPATANAVAITGARPVIVDVIPGNYTIDSELIEKVASEWRGPERLRAIMPVHEFGFVADMEKINSIARKYDLAVVEDAACALGAHQHGKKAGTFGDVGCFSFHPRKTLTTGEGGAIVTNDLQLAARMRQLRNHGMAKGVNGMNFIEPATNYRLTNFQAALGRNQLPKLDRWIEIRHELVAEYINCLSPLAEKCWLKIPELAAGHSWQTFMIVLANDYDRNEIIGRLREFSIETNLGAQSLVDLSLWGEPEIRPSVGPLLYSQGMALPLFELMARDDVRDVVKALSGLLSDDNSATLRKQ